MTIPPFSFAMTRQLFLRRSESPVLVLGAVAIAVVAFVFGLLVGAGAAGRPAAAVCPREMVPAPLDAYGHVFPDSPTHGPSLRQARYRAGSGALLRCIIGMSDATKALQLKPIRSAWMT